MLEDTTRTRDAISELASYGVRFSLDDFGVGYSSLGYIQSYPISTIKIDEKFIDDNDTDRTSVAIIAANACSWPSRVDGAARSEGRRFCH
jgi:EAL domain-containing protein (putative c-di-GMP-specific phosphodiesterase class I)